jgi:hypothetical protein
MLSCCFDFCFNCYQYLELFFFCSTEKCLDWNCFGFGRFVVKKDNMYLNMVFCLVLIFVMLVFLRQKKYCSVDLVGLTGTNAIADGRCHCICSFSFDSLFSITWPELTLIIFNSKNYFKILSNKKKM